MKKTILFILLALLLLGACQSPPRDDTPKSDLPPAAAEPADNPTSSEIPSEIPSSDDSPAVPAPDDATKTPVPEKPAEKPTETPAKQPEPDKKATETPVKTPPAATTPAAPKPVEKPADKPPADPAPTPEVAPEPEKPAQAASISITGHDNAFSHSGSVVLEEGDTVADVLLRFCADKGIDCKTRGKGKNLYVVGIGGQKEFDFGPLSGWQFSVNGVHASYGCGHIKVQNGDSIVWQYLTEL